MKSQQNRIELVTRPAFQHWLVDVATTWSRFFCGSGDYWQHSRKRFIWLGRGNSADWKECLKGMHSFNTFAFTFVFAICRKSYWMVKLQDYGNWSSIFFLQVYNISLASPILLSVMIEGGGSEQFDLHFPHKSDIGQTNPDVYCGRWSGSQYDSGACRLISRNATHSRCRCNQGKNPTQLSNL